MTLLTLGEKKLVFAHLVGSCAFFAVDCTLEADSFSSVGQCFSDCLAKGPSRQCRMVNMGCVIGYRTSMSAVEAAKAGVPLATFQDYPQVHEVAFHFRACFKPSNFLILFCLYPSTRFPQFLSSHLYRKSLEAA
jgi:hypothetical protein